MPDGETPKGLIECFRRASEQVPPVHPPAVSAPILEFIRTRSNVCMIDVQENMKRLSNTLRVIT